MSKHSLLQKKANNGTLIPADGRNREDINRVLLESKAGTKMMRMARAPEWDVTVRGKGNRTTRVEKVQGQSYRDVEKRVKLGPGEQIQGMTIADKAAAADLEDHKVAARPQPVSPEEIGPEHPFICVKCDQPDHGGVRTDVSQQKES